MNPSDAFSEILTALSSPSSSLPQSALGAIGLSPEQAYPLLQKLFRLAGGPPLAIDLLEHILPHLAQSAHPDAVLTAFERWASNLSSPSTTFLFFLREPLLLSDLWSVLCGSAYLAEILAREPSLYSYLLEPPVNLETYPRYLHQETHHIASLFSHLWDRLNALRRFKRHEFLRIGLQDLTGRIPYEVVVGAITALAEELIRSATEWVLASKPAEVKVPFAVIAMGKLGGRELNYSSDVDLLFVYRSSPNSIGENQETDFAINLANTVVEALSKITSEGYLFRVDLRLRPEGRFGPPARSLSAYKEYFDQWAQAWEHQALIKARFIAGDPSLGEEFEEFARERAYPEILSQEMMEELRDNKLMVEEKVYLAGETHTNVKEGWGAIRDIEFSLQWLQMLFGSRYPLLQTPNTLEALQGAQQIGLLDPETASFLKQAYIFLRTVEHRLQLYHDRPERCLPSDPKALEALSRRMGYPPGESPRFLEDYRKITSRVREIYTEIFAFQFPSSSEESPLRRLALSLDTEVARAHLKKYFIEKGFQEVEQSYASVLRMAVGTPQNPTSISTRRAFATLFPSLLLATERSPDPDTALRGLERIVESYGLMDALYRTLSETPSALEALLKIIATAPPLVNWIAHRPALLDALFEPDFLLNPPSAQTLATELSVQAIGARTLEGRLRFARRLQQREVLRTIARDLLLSPPWEESALALSELADLLIQFLWESLGEEGSRGFTVIGLGKLGGQEMGYRSDLDLVYVFDDRVLPWSSALKRARAFTDALTTPVEGEPFYPVDLRLRPEGRQGPIAVSLATYERYFAQRMQTWEKQSLIKSRWIAGDKETAGKFLKMAEEWAYPKGPSADLLQEIRLMKQRIEQERALPDPSRNLKLGPGGLSDVEFLVQLLQIQYGYSIPDLRQRNTLKALSLLEHYQILSSEEVNTLSRGYRWLSRVRNILSLRGVQSEDFIPTEERELKRITRALRYPDPQVFLEEQAQVRKQIREIFEKRFYQKFS